MHNTSKKIGVLGVFNLIIMFSTDIVFSYGELVLGKVGTGYVYPQEPFP
jgi:hypothetical protein